MERDSVPAKKPAAKRACLVLTYDCRGPRPMLVDAFIRPTFRGNRPVDHICTAVITREAATFHEAFELVLRAVKEDEGGHAWLLKIFPDIAMESES